MGHCSATNRNKALTWATAQMDGKHALREKGQTQKVTHCMYASINMKCPERASPERDAVAWLPRAGSVGMREGLLKGYRVSFGGAKNALW